MFKVNVKRIKSAVVGGAAALAAITAPMSGVTFNASAAGSDNYAKLLQYSLYFYDANMCGTKVDETTQLSWRSDCHTADDVDGGFHDAGDHVMFGLPQGYTASTLGWSYYEFSDAYDSLGQTAHFKTISDYFCEFFRNSTVLDSSGNVTNFLYQKGNGDTDHAYWGAPEKQTNNRQQYWTTNSASDIAAEYAAALALSYINFGNEEDLTYAKALYAFSTKYNKIETNGTSGFYSSGSYKDDQAWAAGWLYIATGESVYKTDCANKQQSLGWAHCWDNVSVGAACVNAHITGDWSKVNSYLGSNCTSSSYLFMDKWGSARLNASMQFAALVATKNSSADYSSWSKNQMNYLLGDNPANTCFVVGFADNSASKPHHRAASGTTSASSTAESKYTLVGALVGGPSDASGTYQDKRSDYVCNEVACDYNAGLVGSAAGLYSIYGTGSLDSSIVGVKSTSAETVAVTTAAVSVPSVQTTTATEAVTIPEETTAAAISSTSSGTYTATVIPDTQIVKNVSNSVSFTIWDAIPEDALPVSYTVKFSSASAMGTVCYAAQAQRSDYSNYQIDRTESFGTEATVSFDTSEIKNDAWLGGPFTFSVWYWDGNDAINIDEITVEYELPGTASDKQVSETTVIEAETTETTTTTTEAPEEELVNADITMDTDGNWHVNADGAKAVELTFSGTPNGEANGAVGYMSNEWNTIRWRGTFDSNGLLTTVVELPEGLSDIQIQSYYAGIWDSAKSSMVTFDINLESAVLICDAVAETTAAETTTEITTTTTATTVTEETTVTEATETTTETTTEATAEVTTAAETEETTEASETETATEAATTEELSAVVWGDADCNGKLQINDAVVAMSYVSNPRKYTISEQGLNAGDVYNHGDGVDNMDALYIQKLCAHVIAIESLQLD